MNGDDARASLEIRPRWYSGEKSASSQASISRSSRRFFYSACAGWIRTGISILERRESDRVKFLRFRRPRFPRGTTTRKDCLRERLELLEKSNREERHVKTIKVQPENLFSFILSLLFTVPRMFSIRCVSYIRAEKSKTPRWRLSLSPPLSLVFTVNVSAVTSRWISLESPRPIASVKKHRLAEEIAIFFIARGIISVADSGWKGWSLLISRISKPRTWYFPDFHEF